MYRVLYPSIGADIRAAVIPVIVPTAEFVISEYPLSPKFLTKNSFILSKRAISRDCMERTVMRFKE